MKTSKQDEDILSLAAKRLEVGMNFVSDTRTAQLDDLKFAAGSPDNNFQWPTYATASRTATADNGMTARPMLTINKLPQHIHQVTNDQRQNRTTGKVIPANDEGDVEVAEVFEGMIRHINDISDSNVAYDRACENEVTHGEGYFRIITEYADEDSFDQEVKILSIQDSFSVYMDPYLKKPCGEDAEWAMILENISKDEFENKYPDATPIGSIPLDALVNIPTISEDTITIAEYFYKETTVEKLNLYPDNNTSFEGTPKDDVHRKHFGEPIKSRQSERKSVKWIKHNGYEILERSDWAGKYIPVIRVVGNEFLIEGEIYISGLVRNAKDAQRMYNFHASAEVEMIALAPKSPYVGAAGQFEGFEEKWKNANNIPYPYLEYNPVVDEATQTTLPPPQRSQPPMVQAGIIAAKNAASEDIKEATGQYNASLGQQSNERSGKAIVERKHEGDVSTFHYIDNLARAIRYGTRQLIDLIPKIYDTKRVARILGEDQTSGMVQLDPNQQAAVTKVIDQQGNVIKKIYNPSVGKYDVLATTGASYATKRQAALDGMNTLLQANPELWDKIGDIAVKYMDWPGAQEIEARLVKTIPPALLAGDDDPALQQAQQQIQALQNQLGQAHGMLQNVQNSMEAKELAIKQLEANVKVYDAETKRITAMAAVTSAAVADKGIMSEEQIQDIAAGTLHAAIASGHVADVSGSAPMPQEASPQPQEQAPPLDPNKVMVEGSKHVLQANQHAHEAHMAELATQQPQAQAQEG